MNSALIIALFVEILIVVAVYVWTSLALAAVFRKTGDEPWQAWVPLWNSAVLLRRGGFSPWWMLLVLFPGLGSLAVAVLQIVACHRVGRRLGVGAGMTVLAALLFPVWASIVGWGSAAPVDVAPAVERTPRTGTRVAAPPAPPSPFDQRSAQPVMPPSAGGVISSVPGAPHAAHEPVLISPAPEAPAPEVPVSAPPAPLPPAPVVPAPAEPAPLPPEPLPSAARFSVPAPAEPGPAEPDPDATVLSVRHPSSAAPAPSMWTLHIPDAAPTPITADVVIVGRGPAADADIPQAQLVALVDRTRTVSKTHARFDRRGDGWTVTDLHSTNGVLVVGDDGVQSPAAPGVPTPMRSRVLLGDAEVTLERISG